MNVSSTGYDLDRVFDLKLDQAQPSLLAALEQQPGVAAVSAVKQVPLYGPLPQRAAVVGGKMVTLSHNFVDHRFFAVLDLPVEGRGFTAQEASTNARVAVVSQATARRLWPGRSPFGQAITIPDAGSSGQPAILHHVIGVVPDVTSGCLFRGKDATAVYLPAAAGQQEMQSAFMRIHGDARSVVARVRTLCASGTDATGCEPVSLREVSNIWRFPFAAAASLAAALGAFALLLTAVGLYGVTSYFVRQRRREIGLHLALGASPAQITLRVLREALRCVAVGFALGLPACLALSRVISSTVFGIQGLDLRAYSTAPALLAVVVGLAGVIPARRAARADPMASLRIE